jgi:drug/metabolite transporter (DMT)-like permease
LAEHGAARGEQGKGLALVLASAAGYAVMPILAKLAYAAGVTTPALLAYRFLIATALFGLFAPRGGPPLPWRRRAALWAIGVVFVANAAAYFAALEQAPASVVALILYTYPVIVTLLAAAIGLDPLTRRGVIAAALAVGGVALTAELRGGVSVRGSALALLGAVIYSAYVILCGRFAADVPSEAVARHVSQVAAVLYLAWAAARGELDVPARFSAWAPILGVVIFSTLIASRAFLAGMARIGPARASVASSIEVVLTVGLAVTVLREVVTRRQLAGGALIVGAVAFQNLGVLGRLRRRARAGRAL